MKRSIDVHTGEVMAGQGEVVLKSETNGACMVIVAYDKQKKIGALAHALYISGRLDKKWHYRELRNASAAIDEMIEDMVLVGANRNNIEVCLVTGENVPHEKNDPEYHQNCVQTLNLLKEKNIRVSSDPEVDIGKGHVVFDVSSGDISYA